MLLQRHKMGLGSLILETKQQEAILAEMGWDGTELDENGASVPYRLTKQWFEKTIFSALEAAVAKLESHQSPSTTPQGE